MVHAAHFAAAAPACPLVRDLLTLVARDDPAAPDALVLGHPCAAAYCLPGVRRRGAGAARHRTGCGGGLRRLGAYLWLGIALRGCVTATGPGPRTLRTVPRAGAGRPETGRPWR